MRAAKLLGLMCPLWLASVQPTLVCDSQCRVERPCVLYGVRAHCRRAMHDLGLQPTGRSRAARAAITTIGAPCARSMGGML